MNKANIKCGKNLTQLKLSTLYSTNKVKKHSGKGSFYCDDV